MKLAEGKGVSLPVKREPPPFRAGRCQLELLQVEINQYNGASITEPLFIPPERQERFKWAEPKPRSWLDRLMGL